MLYFKSNKVKNIKFCSNLDLDEKKKQKFTQLLSSFFDGISDFDAEISYEKMQEKSPFFVEDAEFCFVQGEI